MAKVTGIGGVFLRADDPEELYEWYEQHLGIAREQQEGAAFHWRDAENPERKGLTAWSIFRRDSKYFDPSRAQAMINYRVDNLDELLEALRASSHELKASPFGRVW
jgi:hypothetical protein